VRNNLTADNVGIGGPADEVRRAVQREVADDALHRLRLQYVLALAAMTALSVLLGWLVAGRALRGLQQITTTARRVSQDTLDERIALEGPRDELKELADTFDEMLERLSAAFASQRRFVANASHELRTPLTVMRTELEVTLADPDASNAELREMAQTVHGALDRTERLVQALLTLARSEGAVARRDPVDLATAAQLALEHTARDAEAAGLSITADLHAAPVRGDRRLLERLVANLVENAVGHNRPGGRVSVTTATRNGHSVVDVVNDGDVLDPATLPRLLEPFQRSDRGARGDGVGLGLSIVRSVCAPR
jgi:signal transduction histidine kinase